MAHPRSPDDPRPAIGLFAPDFDDPAAQGGVINLDDPDPADPPPPAAETRPAITPEMLEAARAEGHEEGRAEIAAAREAEHHALLSRLLDALRDSDAAMRAAVDEAGSALARLVLASVASAFPTLSARHGGAELARFTAEVTAMLSAEPRIVIRLHPAMLPHLENFLAGLEPERREAIMIEPREALAQGDARIAWRHGLAVRDGAALQAHIAAVLAPLGLAPSDPPAPALRDIPHAIAALA